jgi:hypothetical protein
MGLKRFEAFVQLYLLRNVLAYCASTVLFAFIALERVEHLETLTIFEVTFPGRVEGIRLCFYFNVPPDGYLCRITKRCHDWLTIWPILTRLRSKDPIP